MKFKVKVITNNNDTINFETEDYNSAEELINDMLEHSYFTIHNVYIGGELAKVVINNSNVNYIIVK